MALEWIPHWLKRGNAVVECHTCGETCEFDPTGRVYECDCEFGATAEALAIGLPGYTAYGDTDTKQRNNHS
jgi:hypothetical protein